MKSALAALILLASSPAYAGLQCTWAYPQGVFAPEARPTTPPPVCHNGDLESTWGQCVPLFRA